MNPLSYLGDYFAPLPGVDVLLQCKALLSSRGYPCEQHEVTTADGYINILIRIPRKESRYALFLQCGLGDTSVGWIIHPSSHGLAIQAWNLGYDIFLSNVRGTDGRYL